MLARRVLGKGTSGAARSTNIVLGGRPQAWAIYYLRISRSGGVAGWGFLGLPLQHNCDHIGKPPSFCAPRAYYLRYRYASLNLGGA